MSAPKFTPGPWVYRFRSAGTCVETESGRAVAVASPTPGVGDYDANARLIAAAPEMYEALERLLRTSLIDGGTRCAECEQHVENTSLRTCEWCSARAVLAKAVPQ